MKILGIERDKTACNYYRLIQPLNKLDEQGLADVCIIQESELGTEKAAQAGVWADIITFQRPATEAWFKFIKLMRKNGKLIVSDYDDDPFNTSPLNPYYQYIGVEEHAIQWPDGTKEMLWSESMTSPTGQQIFNIERNINHRDMFHLSFKKSDMVTCTTDILREEFLKINPNVTVLPNVIDMAFFPPVPKMLKDEIRIGWQGGCSHYEDLFLVRDAIVDVLKRHCNVKFVFFGDMRLKGLFTKCPQNQLEFHNWVNHSAYPYKLALLNLDIGLCPIVDNRFNRNKSSIKWMEYSCMKFMTIASNIPPYSKTISNGNTGLLADENTESWTEKLEMAISDSKLRNDLANNAYDDVKLNHNADTKSHLWIEAYNKLLQPELVGV